MFSVSVEAEFSAAHRLNNYKGKCEHLHGHNWKVQIFVVSGNLNKIGLVFDFVELKKKTREILKGLDHKFLNEINYFKDTNPTSENIAKYIYLKLTPYFKNKSAKLAKVCVWETQSSRACYEVL